jgi:hypothetical protein
LLVQNFATVSSVPSVANKFAAEQPASTKATNATENKNTVLQYYLYPAFTCKATCLLKILQQCLLCYLWHNKAEKQLFPA